MEQKKYSGWDERQQKGLDAVEESKMGWDQGTERIKEESQSNAIVKVNRHIRADADSLFKVLIERRAFDKWIYHGLNWTADTKNEIVDWAPREKVILSWNSLQANNTLVTIQLNPLKDGTNVSITHENLKTEKLRRKYEEGWKISLQHLNALFNKGGNDDL